MPYSHYLRRSPEIPEAQFLQFAADVKVILEAVEEMGIKIAGPTGEGSPILEGSTVAFNGARNCGHRFAEIGLSYAAPGARGVAEGKPEIVGSHWAGASIASRHCGGSCAGRLPTGVFYIDRKFRVRSWDQLEKGRYFQFVETDFKPYDLAVTAVLVRLKERCPDEIILSSDGAEEQWEEAKDLCRGLFGWGRQFALEPKWSPNL